jgi:hypothetical protein
MTHESLHHHHRHHAVMLLLVASYGINMGLMTSIRSILELETQLSWQKICYILYTGLIHLTVNQCQLPDFNEMPTAFREVVT